ncbi:MAG: TetR family transcriptional regulator C-terminal domain-containing protein [Acidiferrobacter sp.]
MGHGHACDVTRSKLLDAAFGEVYRCGFQAAGIAAILHQTGLTKGALYHHFPNKHALGLAVVDEVIQGRLEASVFRPLQEAPRPVVALLKILEYRARVLDDDTIKLGCPLNNLVQEMSPVDAEFRTHLAAVLTRWRMVLRAALLEGQRQQEIRADVDCDAAALFILAAWEGCWGIAKNQQSVVVFRQCMVQLQHYVRALTPDPSRT